MVTSGASAFEIGSQIIGAYTTGFTGMVTYIPTTLNSAFNALFVDSNGNLTIMVYVLFVLGGVSLVMGILYLVYNLIRSKIG